MKKLMVVGLMFANNQVLLIKKNRPKGYTGLGRPTGMIGKLNGVGGVVLDSETAIECLIRKTQAECGLKTVGSQWVPFHEIQGADYTVLFAKCAITPAMLSTAASPTDEAVSLLPVDKLANQPLMGNISWLVAMARDNDHNYSISEDMSMGGRLSLDGETTMASTPWNSKGTTSATPVAGPSVTGGQPAAGTTAPPSGNTVEAPEKKAEGGTPGTSAPAVDTKPADGAPADTTTPPASAPADGAPADTTTPPASAPADTTTPPPADGAPADATGNTADTTTASTPGSNK